MLRRKGRGEKQFDHVDYTQLIHTDSDFIDSQFAAPPVKIPWKAIAFATLLFVAGSALLVIAILIMSGCIDSTYADRMWPAIILGFIMVIPGAYYVRIALFAYCKVPGYSFDDIPDFN